MRLLRGDYAEETVYGDPVEQARGYQAGGASRLHVVDLDAARSGVGANDDVIAAIAAAIEIPIEVGGGVRSVERATALFEIGVATVVVGTVAIEDTAVLNQLASRYPGRVAVGLDHRRVELPGGVRREVAVRGWEVGSGVELVAALERIEPLELAAVIVTDISRDGTLEGPDLDGLRVTLATTSHAVIASGGVGRADDLLALGALSEKGNRIAGVIVGRALLSGALSLSEALDACAA